MRSRKMEASGSNHSLPGHALNPPETDRFRGVLYFISSCVPRTVRDFRKVSGNLPDVLRRPETR